MFQRSLRLPAAGADSLFLCHLRGLRQFAIDQPSVEKRVLVCLESRRRRTEDGILVLPAVEFGAALEAGELF